MNGPEPESRGRGRGFPPSRESRNNAVRSAPREGSVRRFAPLVTLTVGLVWAFAAAAVSAAGLTGLSVVLSSLAPGHANTRVFVRFALEEGGPALSPSDYIHIRFEGFSNVGPPTGGGGWTGEPSFGVSGNTAFVTGVSAASGAVITVTGVSVTNPPAGADRVVSVELASSLLSDSPFASGAARPTEDSSDVAVSGTVPPHGGASRRPHLARRRGQRGRMGHRRRGRRR